MNRKTRSVYLSLESLAREMRRHYVIGILIECGQLRGGRATRRDYAIQKIIRGNVAPTRAQRGKFAK